MPARCQYCESSSGNQDLAVGTYLGHVARSASSSSCHLSIVKHGHAGALPEHAHDWPFISMLLKGSYVSRTRTREMEFERGLAAFHPRSFQHRDEIGRHGGLFLCVQLSPELLDDADERRGRIDRDLIRLSDDQPYLTLGALYCAMWANADSLTLNALSAELAGQLLVSDSRRDLTPPPWLRRVEERLREQRPVSLAELSQDAGVHSTTLTRLFRRHRHCSIGEFRARYRSKQAFFEVIGGEAPLADVSFAAGYADQSHMTRDFKLAFGLAPGKVRRRAPCI